MYDYKRPILLIFIMAGVSFVVGAIAMSVLYRAALDEQRARLTETAASQARLMESIAHFNQDHLAHYPAGAEAATLEQIEDAHRRYKGFGETGGFAVGRREGDNIVFLHSHRRGLEKPDPVPLNSKLAEPMRRALRGERGTAVALDYRGVSVLAAYEPVSELNVGIVAKIDMTEVRAPFIRAGLLAVALGLIVVLLGSLLFYHLSEPMIRQLRQSERQLRQIIDLVPHMICAKDRQGRFVLANRAVAEALGTRVENLIGCRESEFRAAPDELERSFADDMAVLKTRGQKVVPEQVWTAADGAVRFLQTTKMPLVLVGEKEPVVLTVAVDVTERRRAQQALRESEAFTRAVLASPVANIAVLDGDGWIVAVNPQWEQFAEVNGLAPGAPCVGTNYLDVCRAAVAKGDETARQALDGLQAVLEGREQIFTLEYPCHSPTEKRWFQMVVTPTDLTSGGVVVAHVSITERKKAEEAVRESEERMRAVLKTAADAIITIDRQGTINTVNPAAERMFGYAAEELVGKNVGILMPAPYREEHDAYIARYLKTGEARVIGVGRELVARRKDGSVFPADVAVSEMNDLQMFTGIIRDISDRKELQREVLEIAAEEDRRIGHELHDNIQQQLAGLGLLAQSLSESLSQKSDSDAARAARMAKGIDEAGKEVHLLSRGLVPVEIDAEGLRAALSNLAAGIFEAHRIDCRFHSEGAVQVADNFVATHLYRIAQEALNNAIKHARAERIQISLLGSDEHVALQVLDNGIGLGDKPRWPQGMGLRIMEYRAGLIGATLQIGGASESGTLVRCVVSRRARVAAGV